MGINIKLKKEVYSTKDLTRLMGESTSIYRKADRGELVNVGRGYYAHPDLDYRTAIFNIISKYHEDAVISKSSALFEYGLTDFQTENIDLDVPRESSYRLDTDLFNFKRTSESKIFSITEKRYGDYKCRIYTPERAIFEVLYLEKEIGNLAREVCRKYIQKYDFKQSELSEISRKFGTRGKELLNLLLSLNENRSVY